MSKQKKTESETAVEQGGVAAKAGGGLPLPAPLLAAFVIVVLAGTALYATREKRTEASLYDALQKCNATVRKEENGLKDSYGVVQFSANTAQITEYLSACEMQPQLAARIFRQALKDQNSDAKLIALYSAFFLTSQKQLVNEDFNAIAELLKPPAKEDTNSVEIRKVAQRALSDLIVCAKVEDALKFEALPPNLPAVKNDKSPAFKIQTREETVGGKKVLAVRWSDADLAHAWWQAYSSKGAWNNDLQRFVITEARVPSLTPPEAPVPPQPIPPTPPKSEK